MKIHIWQDKLNKEPPNTLVDWRCETLATIIKNKKVSA
jgi:hypothetical protein